MGGKMWRALELSGVIGARPPVFLLFAFFHVTGSGGVGQTVPFPFSNPNSIQLGENTVSCLHLMKTFYPRF